MLSVKPGINLDTFCMRIELISLMRKYPVRKANRLRGFDYSSDNLYFVTSCVKNRVCCFGRVVGGKMHLNAYGKIAEQQWQWLANQYTYVVLHAFIAMPNHVHGIIEIDSPIGINEGTSRELSVRKMKIKSLSELMGAYKTTVSKKIHQAGYAEFAWHRSFHDYIIRDERAYHNIKAYIENNPSKWDEDRFFRQVNSP